MVKTITNQMMRNMMSRVIAHTDHVQTNITPTLNKEKYVIEKKKVTHVKGNILIATDGTRANLWYPFPGVYWKCLAKSNKEGVCKLSTPLEALFIITADEEEENICLATYGSTKDFEVRFHVGTNEIRLNRKYISIKSDHIIQNGIEVKEEDDGYKTNEQS